MKSITKALPGLVLVAVLGVFAFWADGYMKTNFKKFYDVAHFNYVLIAIIAGMLIRNTVGVPSVVEPGLRYSTVLTKAGIVVMIFVYDDEGVYAGTMVLLNNPEGNDPRDA